VRADTPAAGFTCRYNRQAGIAAPGDVPLASKLLSDVHATVSLTVSVLREYVAQIAKARIDRRPITSVERLIEFNQMRGAYVAQTSLYGYLKTRMGTKYVQLFQDDTFAASIDKAKWAVFASCLADLSVFSCALVQQDSDLDRDGAADLAIHCFSRAVDRTFESGVRQSVGDPAIAAFQARACLADWHDAAEGENAFGRSPIDLIAFAPVIDEFKELDSEIVMNSMRFRWRDVRQQLRRRLSAAEISEDWNALRVRGRTAASRAP
jgi:hypothetical protein